MPERAHDASQEPRKQYPIKAEAYKILEEVGQGMSAVVYKALCIPLNEVVAIKSLDLEKCSSSLVSRAVECQRSRKPIPKRSA